MISIVEKARDALKGTFLKSAEEANEVAKAIKRKRKFTPSTLAQAFILALLQNPKASHADIASVAAVSGVDVSPQAVEQRYSKSLAAFFKALFELGASDRLKCRLVAWRVPEEIANTRRRKTRATALRKTGHEPSKESLAACDWEFLVTNLSEAKLSFKEAIVLYRARWQIELLFKRWKSYGKIDELDGSTDIVKMTRFWARLCAALIQHWLTVAATWSPALSVSLAKTAKLVRQIASEIASLLSSGGDLTILLERFCRQARAGCRLTKRKTAPGTLQLLRDPELLEYCLT